MGDRTQSPIGRLLPAALKSIVVRALRRGGYQLINVRQMQRSVDARNRPAPIPPAHDSDGLFSEHSPRFEQQPRFQTAWNRALRTNYGVDPGTAWRTHLGLWAASVAARAAGDFVECGVNAGFLSSAILTYLDWESLGKKFYLVDTFDGPPLDRFSETEVGSGAYAKVLESVLAGAYVTDLDAVRRNFSEWRGVEIVKGTVPDVLPSLPVQRIAFLHIDMNCAFPELEALRFFWPRMSPGGVVLLDDYSRKDYEALGDAMDGLGRDLGAEIASLPTGQGLIVR